MCNMADGTNWWLKEAAWLGVNVVLFIPTHAKYA